MFCLNLNTTDCGKKPGACDIARLPPWHSADTEHTRYIMSAAPATAALQFMLSGVLHGPGASHNQGWGAEVMDEDSFHDEDGGQGPGTPEGAGGKVRGVNGVATKKISLSSACWSPWLALSSVCGVVKIREALGLGLARPGHQPPLTLSSSSSHLASQPDQRLDKQCTQHTTFSCLLPLFTDQSDSRLLILDTC